MSDNPYRPGAAHPPPYLAGRETEQREFERLLQQAPILQNILLTGVRGIGKTVLMREALRKSAVESGWLWVDSNISEAVSASENHLVQRILTDLNTYSADWPYASTERYPLGFTGTPESQTILFDYSTMMALYEQTPGLTSDKLKRVLLIAWELLKQNMPTKKGIIFAWDEAQHLTDRRANDQYPLGVLLDVFSSLQHQDAPFILVLAGLPTLFPNLVASRTYAERMFRVMTLANLNHDDSRNAIEKPLSKESKSIQKIFRALGDTIYDITKGYPYFIQFWCRELYDYITGVQLNMEGKDKNIVTRITHKLDVDFFEARWSRLTDRQRDLLIIIANLDNSDDEFTVQEIVDRSKQTAQAFSSSHVNQMLGTLFTKGIVFKTRHGKYVLSIPLFAQYIRRHTTL